MSHIYQPTDVVLAKVKGYPAWPAMVVPTELIPQHILRLRHQQSAKQKPAADEEIRDDEQADEQEDENPVNYIFYSNILKFRKFDSPCQQYCVKFFCDDSYIWVKPADLKPLTIEDCQKWLAKPRNKKLIPAYEMASRGSEGIDVWEFIEYGSAGKPEEEAYEEPYEDEEDITGEESSVEYEDESSGERQRPSRTSARQKKNRESKSTPNRRSIRSRKRADEREDEDLDSDEEILEPKAKRAKIKSKANKKRLVVKYKFEDDEDWTLVGRGPQDLSVQDKVSPFVNKLSQKRNMEWHLETKLELVDRVNGVNKLLLDILTSNEERDTANLREDCEIVLDELNVALSTKGANDEFATVFQSSAELLSYFRLLFNMKSNDLKDWRLWDQFQHCFALIYGHEFIPDNEQWTAQKTPPEEDGTATSTVAKCQTLEEQDGLKQEIET
ncbi:hypothetical protein HG536_0G00770 [Torulaspora globosa]|uniref:PWWP domain-containing protein n=1 Tax=Torulaspora globosa TaxID=48254 RepID=A0A7G3ZL34_9SACH|nr:uncharacterized protein HG536_0G00770 [Torulaspora globosa]QLL34220.1 hypothetical protein HG536_0G00770 [Torulaspora globosa]